MGAAITSCPVALAIFARCRPFGLVDLIEDLPAGGQVVPPGVGQSELACRPCDEASPEVPLEIRQFAADRGQRHAEAPACRRQAAAVGDGGKDGHGVEAIHCSRI